MKSKMILAFICTLFVLGLVGCGGATAAVTPETVLAQIPSLYTDDARQAEGTFVGPVLDRLN